MDLVHTPHTWPAAPNSLILLHPRPCVPSQPLLTAMPSLQAHPAHLVVVPEVTDPHMLAHVGMVKVLPKPADITPVEIPFPFAGGGGGTEVRTEDLSTAGVIGFIKVVFVFLKVVLWYSKKGSDLDVSQV